MGRGGTAGGTCGEGRGRRRDVWGREGPLGATLAHFLPGLTSDVHGPPLAVYCTVYPSTQTVRVWTYHPWTGYGYTGTGDGRLSYMGVGCCRPGTTRSRRSGLERSPGTTHSRAVHRGTGSRSPGATDPKPPTHTVSW